MILESYLTKAVRIAIVAGTAGIMFGASTYAAEEVSTADKADNVERIAVTGSRIVREGAVAPTPVTVISGEELLSTGVTNIGEALNQLPALGSTYSLANSGRFIGTSGLNLLDLRNMGTDRTLVLVDGRRHVASSAGTSAVDINTIPSAWVERVEVITGGASAIYGADAVTGVVNFILKKNVTGLDVDATFGIADDSDFNKKRFSVSYGKDFAEGKGNIAGAFEYSAQSQLTAFDREQTATSFSSIRNTDPNRIDDNDPSNPDSIFTPNAGRYTLSNAGSFGTDLRTPNEKWWTFNPDGSLRAVYNGTNFANGLCADCDSINLRQFDELQPKFDRYNFNLKGSYAISEDMNFYAEGKYVRSESQDEGQPAFFNNDPRNNIKIDNAFMKDDLRNLMTAKGLNEVRINRMMKDLGVRIEDDTRETQRYVVGLEGNVLEDWSYDVFATYGQTDLERVNRNNLVFANYQNALDSILVNGVAVCRDEQARAAGCMPVNIFGDGQVSQGARDYINTTSVGTSVIKQTVLGGSLTNSALFDLPAGAVGFSTGVEYRKEESQVFEPDNAKGTFFNVLGEDKGEFDVKEVFAEFSVPLLSDLPLIRQLDAEIAARYANYSTIGSATTWKAGLSWEVYDDLRIRTTYSEAIRAPNISELYGAQSQNFFRVDDSCKASELATLADSELRRKNCAALGIPADFDSDYDASTLPGFSGGNNDLKAEESTSYTVGAVYQPSFVENLVFTVDFWDIQIDDAISGIAAQDIIDKCVDSPSGINNQYCALLKRDPNSHEITQINQYSLNIAKLEATGIDFDIGYNVGLFDGDLRSSLVVTKLLDRKDYSFQEEPDVYDDYVGVVGTPEWRANLTFNYLWNSWEATWRTRFIDGVSLYTDQELALNANPNSLLSYGDYYISDMGIGYNFDNGIALKFGVDNLFDRDLPYGSMGITAGTALYDNVGRFFYTSITFSL